MFLENIKNGEEEVFMSHESSTTDEEILGSLAKTMGVFFLAACAVAVALNVIFY